MADKNTATDKTNTATHLTPTRFEILPHPQRRSAFLSEVMDTTVAATCCSSSALFPIAEAGNAG